MYIKARNVYYRVTDNLSIRLDNFLATFEPKISYSYIVLNDCEGYDLTINNALLFIHEHQFKENINEIIYSIFKNNVSNVEISFEPRDILKINLSLMNMIPVNLEGKILFDSDTSCLIYKFELIKTLGIPVSSILDAVKSIPGLSISYSSPDGRAKIENDKIVFNIKKLFPEMTLKFNIVDVYFSEHGLFIELKDKTISEIQNKTSFEFPESFIYLMNGKIKFNNVEIEDPKIVVVKDSGSSFAFNLRDYRDIIDQSIIEINKNDEIILTLVNKNKNNCPEKEK